LPGEQATPWDEYLVQLVYYRGFADPGIAGHEHEFRCAVGHNSVESCNQCLNLALPAIELFRDQQPIRPIVLAKREPIDAAI
jgi:hypothetical protein